MIDFRYHVVSIIAVFLALALGLFVGSTSLQDAVVHNINNKADSVSHQNDALRAQVRDLQNRLGADQAFNKALLPYAVSGRLSGQLVTVVSAPGTSDSVRKQVLADIDAAGGTISADIRLQPAILDPQQDALLTALTERVTIPGHAAAAADAGPDRAAAQLATVLGVRPSSRGVPPNTVETVLAAYSTAKLISVAGGNATPRPGTLAVVLTGSPPAPTADPGAVKAAQSFVLALLRNLDDSALGAVLAVPARPAGVSTDMSTAAADVEGLTDHASAVTGVDSAAGQIAVVLALAAQADGVAGQFGPGQGTPLPTASGAP